MLFSGGSTLVSDRRRCNSAALCPHPRLAGHSQGQNWAPEQGRATLLDRVPSLAGLAAQCQFLSPPTDQGRAVALLPPRGVTGQWIQGRSSFSATPSHTCFISLSPCHYPGTLAESEKAVQCPPTPFHSRDFSPSYKQPVSNHSIFRVFLVQLLASANSHISLASPTRTRPPFHPLLSLDHRSVQCHPDPPIKVDPDDFGARSRPRYICQFLGHVLKQKTVFLPSFYRPQTKVTGVTSSRAPRHRRDWPPILSRRARRH